MQIGKAAEASGASAEMIRHHGSIGLIGPAKRRDSSCRGDPADGAARLTFVRRARDPGVPIGRIRVLLALRGDRVGADGCAGDGRPDCPIIDRLAGRRAGTGARP